jgi:mycothiol synthase
VISAPKGTPVPATLANAHYSAVTVRVLDPSSPLDPELYEVMARCRTEENPEEPPRTQAETEAFLRHPPDAEDRDYWIAMDAGQCVGFAQLGVMRGTPAGRLELLVHPDHRRRGHGTKLLEAARAQAKRRSAPKLIAGHATEAGSRFAAAVGAKDDHREVRSLLRLPLPENLRAEPVAGYTLRSWVGATPEPLLETYARAREAVNDAPDSFDHERIVWDAALVRDLEASVEQRRRDIRVTIALDAEDEVVAFTELRVSRTPDPVASTEDTAVVAEHRRRGLARWVKLESLLQLQRDRPDVRLVGTMNAENNDAMRGLNHALGFSPVAVYTTCVLQIEG